MKDVPVARIDLIDDEKTQRKLKNTRDLFKSKRNTLIELPSPMPRKSRNHSPIRYSPYRSFSNSSHQMG